MIKTGEKIAIIRDCRGFTQDYMASQLGIKQNTYSKYELNDEKISDDMLAKISEILGVSVEDIKNPMPIFMSFHNSPNAGISGNNNIIMPQETVDEFFGMIKKKDEQIDTLLAQINKLIEKLN